MSQAERHTAGILFYFVAAKYTRGKSAVVVPFWVVRRRTPAFLETHGPNPYLVIRRFVITNLLKCFWIGGRKIHTCRSNAMGDKKKVR